MLQVKIKKAKPLSRPDLLKFSDLQITVKIINLFLFF